MWLFVIFLENWFDIVKELIVVIFCGGMYSDRYFGVIVKWVELIVIICGYVNFDGEKYFGQCLFDMVDCFN